MRAYSVTLLEREIGIRLALDADRGAAQRPVFGERLWLSVTDTVIGMIAVLGSSPRWGHSKSD